MNPRDGGGDGEKPTTWTKDNALGWWLWGGRRSKGDRGLGDDAHISGRHPGVTHWQLCTQWDCSSGQSWTWIWESHVSRGGH